MCTAALPRPGNPCCEQLPHQQHSDLHSSPTVHPEEAPSLQPRVHRRPGKALLSNHTEVLAPSASSGPTARVFTPSHEQRRKTLFETTRFPQPARLRAPGDQDSACCTSLCPKGWLTPNSDLSCTSSKVSSSPPCSPPASWQCPPASPFTVSYLRTHAGFSHHLGVPTLSSLSASSDMPAEEPAQSWLPSSAHARAVPPGSSEPCTPEPVRHKASSQNESNLPPAQILGEVCQHDTLWVNPNCALQTLGAAEAVSRTAVGHRGACPLC